jgi:hypothetical protein
MQQLDDLCATFLEGYEEVAPVNRARLAAWDAVTGAKDVVDCWRKVKLEHLNVGSHCSADGSVFPRGGLARR